MQPAGDLSQPSPLGAAHEPPLWSPLAARLWMPVRNPEATTAGHCTTTVLCSFRRESCCREANGRVDRVVAVVGAGHIEGMKAHWSDAIDIDELNAVPSARTWAVPWRSTAVIAGLLCTGAAVYVRVRRR